MKANTVRPSFLSPFMPANNTSQTQNSFTRRSDCPCNRVSFFRVPVRSHLDRVLVVGASRGLGLEVAQELSSRRDVSHVTATVRKSKDIESVPSDAVDVMDALDDKAVEKTLRKKFDLVISCFGGQLDDDSRGDYTGNQNLIDSSTKHGVKRFVLISAMGAGDSEGSLPFQVLRTMRSFLLDKSRAELYLRESGLPYTIIRPAPLSEDEYTGNAILTEGRNCYGGIGRKDLAKLVCDAARSESAKNKVLYAIDRTKVLITSPYVRPMEFWETLPVEEFKIQ